MRAGGLPLPLPGTAEHGQTPHVKGRRRTAKQNIPYTTHLPGQHKFWATALFLSMQLFSMCGGTHYFIPTKHLLVKEWDKQKADIIW